MIATLAEKTCTPWRGGILPLTPEEAEMYRAQAPAWGAARRGHADRADLSLRTKKIKGLYETAAKPAVVLQGVPAKGRTDR